MSASPPSKAQGDRSRLACGVLNETQMAQLAADMARATRAGDSIALSGDLGAGKTSFARAFIRAAAGDPNLDVPSPTFTLVQSYDGQPPVIHADLYRIADASELDELGLFDATEDSVLLVEWPERASSALPSGRLTVSLAEPDGEDGRLITIDGPKPVMNRVERSLAVRHFLTESGHGFAVRQPLAGDASTRAYETVHGSDRWSAILMDAPPMPDGPPVRNGKPYSQIAHLAEDIVPFIAVARMIRAAGFAAPAIEAVDYAHGIALIEDLGRGAIVDDRRRPIEARYLAAIACLAAMHQTDWPRGIALENGLRHNIPAFDTDVLQIEADLLTEWYAPRATGQALAAPAFEQWGAIWVDLFNQLDADDSTLVMRDFHSPNIIWRDDQDGHDQLGIIDFQDALWGHPAYDVMSLVQDARIDVPPELQDRLLTRYCAIRATDTTFNEPAFRQAAAILGAQRASKILGIFVRLDQRDGKPAYLAHISRIQAYLRRSLAHPALTDLKTWFDSNDLLDARIDPR